VPTAAAEEERDEQDDHADDSSPAGHRHLRETETGACAAAVLDLAGVESRTTAESHDDALPNSAHRAHAQRHSDRRATPGTVLAAARAGSSAVRLTSTSAP